METPVWISRFMPTYRNYVTQQVRTQNFLLREGGGGAEPEAVYNLCFILKIVS
jgi:hypothetical protein